MSLAREGGSTPMKVIFDIDGTLIDRFDRWNLDVVEYAREITDAGGTVYVWTGGGADYAETWGRRLMDGHHIPVAGFFGKADLPEVLALGLDEMVDDRPNIYRELAEAHGFTVVHVVDGEVVHPE